MKIDFNYQFKTLSGEVFRENADEEIIDKDGKKTIKKHPPLTLRKISENVLLIPDIDEAGKPKEMNGTEKCARYDLAMRIHKATSLVDLQSEEITLLKKLIAKGYSIIIVGQAFEILDPHGAGEKKLELEKEPETEEKSKADN